MPEPSVLDGMSFDDRQELKEAVCDAVLERIRHTVSGVGESGRTLLGAKPSSLLSSGFVLPRLNQDGDEETNDIRIAAHGLDLRISGGAGNVRVQLICSIYIRSLPTSQELFARGGRLIPKAEFNTNSKRQFIQRVRELTRAEIPAGTPRPQWMALRTRIVERVYAEMGVQVPNGATVLVGAADTDAADEQSANERTIEVPTPNEQSGDTHEAGELLSDGGRLRIPSQHSKQHSIPQRWTRISIDLPVLELPLPCRSDVWEEAASTYSRTVETAIQQAALAWLGTAEGQGEAWRKVQPPTEAFWSAANWDAFLTDLRATPPNPVHVVPQIQANLMAQAIPEPLNPTIFSIRLALENVQEGDSDLEFGIFDVCISVELPSVSLRLLRLERIKRSYHLAGFMTMPAIGVNCGVRDLGEEHGIRHLKTTFMPRYVLPRMQAKTLPGLRTGYAELGEHHADVDHLQGLPHALHEWLRDIETSTPMSSPEEYVDAEDEGVQQSRFQADLTSWRDEASRIAKGVEVLLDSRNSYEADSNSPRGIPYRAWVLLNQTFSLANNPRPENPHPGWRLFQIAFILAHVPTLASRVEGFEGYFDPSFDEDSASLLYMSTGGGKTEAFFGTIVYALFLDRLRGKERGITAMMHYPLRLLTVQQAQRLARLLAQAELVRRQFRLGGAPFEIGFWVGGSNTPNRTETKPGRLDPALACIPTWSDAATLDEQRLFDSSPPYAAARESWNKIPTCPFCFSSNPTALRRFPELHQALGIVCLNQACTWNRQNAGTRARPVPLPFWVVDSDIYRRAPSILLGTIDKLALLGQNTTTISRISQMFGFARWREGGANGIFVDPRHDEVEATPPQNTERVAPAYSGGAEVFVDPFPSLIVQDEMHLLEESLGTFGGLFETGLFAWLKRLSPLLGPRAARVPGAPDQARLPHVIGATATASDAAKHVRAVYQKTVVQFPHPGPGLHDGFYVGLASFDGDGAAANSRPAPSSQRGREIAAPWGRVYASLMTNGRKHTVTTLSVLAAQATTITRWQRDLSSPQPSRRARAASEMLSCISDSPWRDRRAHSIQSAVDAGQHDRLCAILDLHRIMLTYVTNKKGGDQILSALDPEAKEAHSAMGDDYDISNFSTTLISGGVDIGTIQEVIRAAEQPFDPMTGDISTALRMIVATSAISHGVDVENFNAMAFAGMPSDIAEYIQASSRVGRSHVGFSLLLPTPQNRRDRFVLEVHEPFHRLLERMIAPPAIERWADRALKRTIPSLFQMWLIGVYYQTRFVQLPDDHKADVSFPDRVETVERVLRDPANFADCVTFIRNAIGIQRPSDQGGPVFPQYYQDLVTDELRRISNTIDSTQYAGPLNELWTNRNSGLTPPMTSLRDVDEPGLIRPSDRSPGGRGQTEEQVGNLMAALRNRGVSRRRRSSGSETDADSTQVGD